MPESRTLVQLALSLACGLALSVTWILQRTVVPPDAVVIAGYLVAYGFGAFDLLRIGARGLMRGHVGFDIDLLMLLAAVGAAALGEWVEGTFLLFLFSLANAAEHYAMGRATGAIRALGDLTPPTARLVYPDGRDEVVPIAQVMRGALVLVRPAERIPVDGVVRSGRSAVDQAPITGESIPVDKAPGDQVFAGTVNGDGALQVETTGAAGERTLDRIIQLVADAQASKARTEQLTATFERIFVPDGARRGVRADCRAARCSVCGRGRRASTAAWPCSWRRRPVHSPSAHRPRSCPASRRRRGMACS